jgi:hypothetical protein
MKHVSSASQIPIISERTYIVDIDGVLLTDACNDTDKAFDQDTVEWFTTLVKTLGINNVFILTARDKRHRQETLQDLRNNGYKYHEDNVYFYRWKGEWISANRWRFTYPKIIMIDDQYNILQSIIDHNPDVTCYHVNCQLINPHAIVYDLKDIVLDTVYTYIIDVDTFKHCASRFLCNIFYTYTLDPRLLSWLRTLNNNIKTVLHSQDDIYLDGEVINYNQLPSTLDDKTVIVATNTKLLAELYSINPNIKGIVVKS